MIIELPHLICARCHSSFTPSTWGLVKRLKDPKKPLDTDHGYPAHTPMICDDCIIKLRQTESSQILWEIEKKRQERRRKEGRGW